MTVIEEGKLVRLRAKTVEDARDDYAWRCDDELARFDATAPLRLSFASFLSEYELELRNPGPYRRRYAVDDLSNHHIGNCTYFNIDVPGKEAELGIVIGAKSYWNRGHGRETITLLLKHIFETADFLRVYLYTLDWNLRAQACFRRCGFHEVRRTTEGAYRFVIMEILRSEYEAMVERNES
ncbi:MAG: GNAT family N-acetyltransferase [Dehalococcoidia bacterium]|nr:GNAT family N-acetyltransferase [Dehalococcoidia bacterium]